MSYPDKFKIKDRSDGGVVDVKKVDDGYSFTYQRTGFENFFCKESAENIIKNFYTVVQEEPEMVFPFTYKHENGIQAGTVSKCGNGKVKVTFFKDQNGPSYVSDAWTEADAKRLIKEGKWIVTSVGEQPKDTIKASLLDHCSLTGGVQEDIVIKINSDGVDLATERLTKLAEAIDNVNTSLGIMRQIMTEMSFGNTEDIVVEPVHDYSGFNINFNDILKGK